HDSATYPLVGGEQEPQEPFRLVVPRDVLLVRLVARRLREALQQVFGPTDLLRDERGASAQPRATHTTGCMRWPGHGVAPRTSCVSHAKRKIVARARSPAHDERGNGNDAAREGRHESSCPRTNPRARGATAAGRLPGAAHRSRPR